jgi:hypothetical protein
MQDGLLSPVQEGTIVLRYWNNDISTSVMWHLHYVKGKSVHSGTGVMNASNYDLIKYSVPSI